MAPPREDSQRATKPATAALVERASTLAGPLALAALFALLARWTWGTWPDVLVDFGRELYVPWRLTQGAVLHRDVAWFNGPLSAHFNATVFQVLGASLASLVWVNLALLAVLTGMLWSLLRSLADAFSATLACAVLLSVFGFGQLVGIGNYNFVCPYSHEVTHGVFLAVLSLWSLRRWQLSRQLAWQLAWAGLAGLALGAAFLTKAEVFLAALAGSGTTFLLLQARPQLEATERRLARLAFALGVVFPVLLGFLVLASELPLGTAVRATLGSWPAVLFGGAGELAFYRQGMGLDAPLTRLGELLAWSGRWLVVFAPAVGLAYGLRRTSPAVAPAIAALPLFLAALLVGVLEVRWLEAARPLPLFALVVVMLFAGYVVRGVRPRVLGDGLPAALGFAVFALVLLGKMVLNARVYHYGFALAMPATLLVVAALAGWLPRWLDERGRAGGVLRAACLAVFAVAALGHVSLTRARIGRKAVTLGEGRDAFRADARGGLLKQVLADFATTFEPGATLAVLPEGVMVNWLLRSENPTPYVNFMPPEFLLFGEERIVAAFEARPPDFVLIVHKDTSEYGAPFFGPDYGTALASWVQEHYVQLRAYGDPPLQPGSRFGIRVLRRR